MSREMFIVIMTGCCVAIPITFAVLYFKCEDGDMWGMLALLAGFMWFCAMADAVSACADTLPSAKGGTREATS